MAQTIDFSKETKGISITRDNTKVSYSSNVKFRGYATGVDIANIDIDPFSNQPISQYKVDTSIDTITINGVAFTDNAEDLIDDLRDTVFIDDVIVP